MTNLETKKYSIKKQCGISIVAVLLIATVCFYASKFIDYRITALILLMTVSIVAIVFDIIPVLITAILSGLLLNFFFIQPLFTFHITDTEDILLFLMYLIIALVNAVLTFKIRQVEKKARDKEEKEKTIKLYNTLLNSLSHELRTPIATLIGAVDILKENNQTLSKKNQEDLLSEIDKASIRLNRQVENLLNMSRLETGMLLIKQDWCDVNELTNGVVQKFSSLNTNHIIDFQLNESLPLFKLDSGLIAEVLRNLIHNAVLYTPEKTTIKIEVLQESSNCIIVISDNGNGFPESEIQFAFDKFYRLPHTKTGGSGLGLSIVKGFVEAHNGTITLENNSISGAKFTITIPTETSYLKNLKNE
ncbi:sensor histidine kinase [Flavobacterium alvei]|uniref:sensor histidine kinase n=1 Tax=Flavobacterium alvei TaxID=2080416 RepID=UPI001FAE835F|nr:ATP-binding protein [Flavobacterium alvei]